MHLRIIFGTFLSAMTVTCAADDPTFSIDAHIISTGTPIHAMGACFGLDAVIAEPIAGFSSGGIFDLSTGFATVSPLITDTIFVNGFEDCTP